VDKFRSNPWVWAGFLPWILLGLSYGFDSGFSYGSFSTTRWPIVIGLASGSFLGSLSIAALLRRRLQKSRLGARPRPDRRSKILGLAAGVVTYAVTYVFALVVLVLVFFQMIGVANPDMPLPIWASAIAFGLLVAISIILGSQLPFVVHSVPDNAVGRRPTKESNQRKLWPPTR